MRATEPDNNEVTRMVSRRCLFSESRVAQSQDEHQEVVDCILRNDGDGASEAMKKHVAKTALNILSHIMPDNRKPMTPAARDED